MPSRPAVPCSARPTPSRLLLVRAHIDRTRFYAYRPTWLPVGTIRGDFALAVGRNICHGSDAVESAEKEIGLYVVLYSSCRVHC